MRAEVRCKPCGLVIGELERPTLGELGAELAAVLVGCHARHPHCRHELELEIGGDVARLPGASEPLVELELVCLGDGQKFHTRAPRWLVGALTLVFHTSHEGHPLELVVDGRRWRCTGEVREPPPA